MDREVLYTALDIPLRQKITTPRALNSFQKKSFKNGSLLQLSNRWLLRSISGVFARLLIDDRETEVGKGGNGEKVGSFCS